MTGYASQRSSRSLILLYNKQSFQRFTSFKRKLKVRPFSGFTLRIYPTAKTNLPKDTMGDQVSIPPSSCFTMDFTDTFERLMRSGSSQLKTVLSSVQRAVFVTLFPTSLALAFPLRRVDMSSISALAVHGHVTLHLIPPPEC